MKWRWIGPGYGAWQTIWTVLVADADLVAAAAAVFRDQRETSGLPLASDGSGVAEQPDLTAQRAAPVGDRLR
ncbi:hypothetical protein GCM10009789_39880 [Kribbella sancticallisti]|uniref:Uncharacterized protein n=1 Tax=Kribbella sancticallisti TaxID=460087 RepID=A0ABN2DPD1_9ACTN